MNKSVQVVHSKKPHCADCAKPCAGKGCLGYKSLCLWPKRAIRRLARPLQNTLRMNTTILTAQTLCPDATQLYARYRDFVVRVCIRYVQNHDEAEDLAQEVFLKAGNAIDSFAGQSQPSTWLYRIAVNHCLDTLRQKKRQRDQLATYAIIMEDDCEEEGEETPSAMRQVLDRLRSEMDPINGQIVYLRFEMGMTHDAIAEVRGVSRVAITKRLAKIELRAKAIYAELANAESERMSA